MNSERKSIFITGAASGMGRATARLFAGNGWFIGMYDVNEEGLVEHERAVTANPEGIRDINRDHFIAVHYLDTSN